MRTEKEILQVILDNMDQFKTGLCYLVDKLLNQGKLTREDHSIWRKLIYRHTPKGHVGHCLWPVGEKQPRVEWMVKQINVCNHCKGTGFDPYPNHSTSYPTCMVCNGLEKQAFKNI